MVLVYAHFVIARHIFVDSNSNGGTACSLYLHSTVHLWLAAMKDYFGTKISFWPKIQGLYGSEPLNRPIYYFSCSTSKHLLHKKSGKLIFYTVLETRVSEFAMSQNMAVLTSQFSRMFQNDSVNVWNNFFKILLLNCFPNKFIACWAKHFFLSKKL